ncbi:MAG: PilZ domain-containing protein [Isosphaeraceae bacterium]
MIEQQIAVLSGFQRAFKLATGRDLRRDPRRSSHALARLAWGEGAETRQAPGRVVNISKGGAALSLAMALPESGLVRFRLEGGDSETWIEAWVLTVVPDARGWYRVRIQFLHPCPEAMLAAAIDEGSKPEPDVQTGGMTAE